MRLRLPLVMLLGITVALGCSESPTNAPDSSEAGIAAAKGGIKGSNKDDSLDLTEFKVVRLPAGVDPRIWDAEGREEQLPPEYVDNLLLEPGTDPYAIPEWNWLYVHIISGTPLSAIMADVVLDRTRDGEWTRGEEWIHFIGPIHGHVNDDFSISASDDELSYDGPWDELNDNVYEYKGYMHRPWIGQVDNEFTGDRIQYPDQYDYPGNRPGSHEPDAFVFVFGARLADGSTRSGLTPSDIPGGVDPLEYRVAKYAGPDPDKLIYAWVSDVSYDTQKVRGKMKTYANWSVSFPAVDFTTAPPTDRATIAAAGEFVYSLLYFKTYVDGVLVGSGFQSTSLDNPIPTVDFSCQVEPGTPIEFQITNVIGNHRSGFTESWDPNPAVNDLVTIFPN
ncbi:hypothetical protein ACFL6R_01795 [Gemmatimonadota bacterium]